ncbi:hypothetical protein EV421DRAFT_1794678 [Armillaria borealis]|uniref:Uncharacterized protein n=1 Tax=Armillaria borealis TaxID=47425 RepID=A0AA39MTT0_9AGAR|nr:hypothetical protein EV421DRAFT_1794678 [Armillaria borealis]
MSYDQSNPRRDDEYNSHLADDSYASRNMDVQSQNRRAPANDDTTSYSNNFKSGVKEEARKNSEPSDAHSGHTGEDSSINTGPIRYESYMPGPGDEPENDSTSRDITSSRDSDLYKDHDEGAGRGTEAQRYDAGSNNTGSNDDFGTGDIGQPISNGYDSGSAGWARENAVSGDSQSASRGYAGDSSSTSTTDTSAVVCFQLATPVTSRNDGDDVGRADRSIDTDSRDSGVRSASNDTRDRNNAGSRDESGRGATASTFEEATTALENIGSVGDNGNSIHAPTTSGTYKSGDPTGGGPRTSRDDAEEGTDDNNYGRSPYDAINVGRDSQTTSSGGQTLPSQRDSSTLDDDQQGRDVTTDTSQTSSENVDNAGASTFDAQPSVNEDQTSSEGLQQDRDMTPDYNWYRIQLPPPIYGKSPYDATESVRDSRTTSSDGRPPSIQRWFLRSARRSTRSRRRYRYDTEDRLGQKRRVNFDNFDNQTSPNLGVRSSSDDTGDHGSYDESRKGADTFEAPSGYTGNKSAENTGSIGDSDLGTDAPASSGNVADESEGRKDASATRRDYTEKGIDTNSSPYDASNIRRDSHTTSDARPSANEQTSSTPHDAEQRNITASTPKADVDNDGSSSFDDQPSFGKAPSSEDGTQRDRDASSDTTGRGPGLLHEASYVGRQDASSTVNASTEDVDNTISDNQNEDNQTGRGTASDTTGQDLGSEREDTSTTSRRPTSGADQPSDTIGHNGGREDNKPSGNDRAGAGTDYDHSGYGGYAASTGHHAGGKPGLKDKLRGNAEVLVGRAAKKPELVERGLERKAGNVV